MPQPLAMLAITDLRSLRAAVKAHPGIRWIEIPHAVWLEIKGQATWGRGQHFVEQAFIDNVEIWITEERDDLGHHKYDNSWTPNENLPVNADCGD